MIVFLDSLIVPFVRTARPRSMLLAGGGDGSMITQLLSAGEPAGTVLHIADPAPAFDVSAIRQLAGDRVIVHRADAADVIGLVPVPDLLLLNADPNWYTTDRLLRADIAAEYRLALRAAGSLRRSQRNSQSIPASSRACRFASGAGGTVRELWAVCG